MRREPWGFMWLFPICSQARAWTGYSPPVSRSLKHVRKWLWSDSIGSTGLMHLPTLNRKNHPNVNVGKCTIHGSYGIDFLSKLTAKALENRPGPKMEISSSKHPFKKVLMLVLGRVSDMKISKEVFDTKSDQFFSERTRFSWCLVLRWEFPAT